MASHPNIGYDIVIIDEAQDFSANQIRAVIAHLNAEHALTLVVDTMQRLYPRGYNWSEAGIDLRRARLHRLQQNHRNTIETAKFAKGILEGLSVDDDGTLPDLDGAKRSGPIPKVITGKYSNQIAYAINHIKSSIDLENDSVAFLHPLGWFSALKTQLSAGGLSYEEMTRQREWPTGKINIALCTMHSAKGLEFDHVMILGLNAQVTPHGPESDDHKRETLRRLLAMAVARARSSVIVGYKPGEASSLTAHFVAGTYEEIAL
jgi:superfamily I DNA/RNA helicase